MTIKYLLALIVEDSEYGADTRKEYSYCDMRTFNSLSDAEEELKKHLSVRICRRTIPTYAIDYSVRPRRLVHSGPLFERAIQNYYKYYPGNCIETIVLNSREIIPYDEETGTFDMDNPIVTKYTDNFCFSNMTADYNQDYPYNYYNYRSIE
ncbi:MAG: hypothetical protein EKK63_10150 [Acinetobacter sp.]|uniref:hypothetical protein n=1 Tax=Acinetobacter sp. TaxID=472 RepID=UPI000F9CEFA7|nr:hypothetical protein [Acinetobacter sp.]RUP39351.1 MAG: hypothetical protein EKK63_10150 [Acinetobacter sp.]